MDKVLLIGFRAVGKTTVGRLLSRALNWDFIDTDQEVQNISGKTIKEIVETEGWETFRRIEKEVLVRLVDRKKIVIALGGGGILHQQEIKALKSKALVVWLKASPETIIERMLKDEKTLKERPKLTSEDLTSEVLQVLKLREPLYREFADLSIDTEQKSPKEILDLILKQLKNQNMVGEII
ncbi:MULTISPECIES: shikimate kinase [Thermodesulfobacterium]|jgi:shikimate kinase|uniref:Shikimate kinase n=2 Tax=Thermodesulfobacterium commune TaxID=1741 RepID=A0A075WTG3_9BACT|nr:MULTISPECIES: shikimate kinase [Thermodesulfobacterium]EDX27548.1 shikimate kinase [Escherichia coli B171]KUJ98169.1 MAG: Shikimate kinase 1 [Thermodesulfobacterium sp. 37_54]KUK19815.1 MAG: Shikimate kinase 1 [Thermodesulfobacterium commune]AIH03673.1 shikimate kinase [Thermodesulfobacterium commune DSM 2178]KUK38658.1 MAG: Shikimate kinase 1 [Thermodesulfobacterium commune]